MSRRWHFGSDRLLPYTDRRHAGAFHDRHIHHKISAASTLCTQPSGLSNRRMASSDDKV
jgi:hypothetical protein